jgi:hypothetical protein
MKRERASQQLNFVFYFIETFKSSTEFMWLAKNVTVLNGCTRTYMCFFYFPWLAFRLKVVINPVPL